VTDQPRAQYYRFALWLLSFSLDLMRGPGCEIVQAKLLLEGLFFVDSRQLLGSKRRYPQFQSPKQAG
jgi:hypothetical protein